MAWTHGLAHGLARAGAIRAYQRSLELDPGNTNATQQVSRLRQRR